MDNNVYNGFIEGNISAPFIAYTIAKHKFKPQVGAHQLFMGQVRADTVGDRTVTAMEYTAYEPMAKKKFNEIKEAAFSKFDISCVHFLHSLGRVDVGDICLFILVSSPHRKAAREALDYMVEEFKAKVPIFGKELFGEDGHQWKTNN